MLTILSASPFSFVSELVQRITRHNYLESRVGLYRSKSYKRESDRQQRELKLVYKLLLTRSDLNEWCDAFVSAVMLTVNRIFA